MRPLSLRSVAIAAFLTAALAQTAPAQTVKIGVFGPLTGDAAAMGASEKEAVELAVKEKNDAGGILGKKVEVIYGDDAGKPEEAVSVAKRLISRDEVLITIGSISSPASLAASQVSRQSETPQIVVAGTAQRITTAGNKWVFRSPVPDTKLVSDLADFINEKFPKLKKFAFLYVNDDFGRGGFEAFKAAGQKYGFEIVGRGALHARRHRLHRAARPDQGQPGPGHDRMVALHRRRSGWQAVRPDWHEPRALRLGRRCHAEIHRARRQRGRRRSLHDPL